MRKLIYILSVLLIPFLCYAGNFNTYNPFTNQPDFTSDKADEISLTDLMGYYGTPYASPPTVEGALWELGASKAVVISTYVPYTGAISDVNLGSKNIITTGTSSSAIVHATSRVDIGTNNFATLQKDSTGNLIFYDTITGGKTLAQLATAGAGDITAVGDCTTGACFEGTSGTILTFNNIGGDGTLDYDGTDFTFNKPITATTLDTGQGANDLYDMDQNVLTTSGVTFDNINITNDAVITGDLYVADIFVTAVDGDSYVLGNLSVGTNVTNGYRLNINGTINATGGNSTQWNEAYNNFQNKSLMVNYPNWTQGNSTYIKLANESNFLTSEKDNLYWVVNKGAIAGANIIASGIVVTTGGATASSTIVDTQYMEYSSGGNITIRDGINVLSGIEGQLKNQTKAVSIYNITTAHDPLLWKTPKTINITTISMALVGGTDVVGALEECDSGCANCVVVNATRQVLAAGTTNITTISNPLIDNDDWLKWNTTYVNGTPSNFGVTIKYNE